jgi:hypothetical protein
MTLPVVMLVLAIVLIDVMVMGALAAGLKSQWGPIVRAFPGVPAAPGAVGRNFQTLRVGMFNLGQGFHIAVDDERVHLSPALMSRIFGLKAVSVPWEHVRLAPGNKKGRSVHVIIAGANIRGPRWAFGLADPEASGMVAGEAMGQGLSAR